MKESEIERKACEWARGRGWLAVKQTPMGVKGWPDRLFISKHGVHVWIEFKAPPNTPTDLQAYRIKELHSHMASAYWVDNVAQAKEILLGHENERDSRAQPD